MRIVLVICVVIVSCSPSVPKEIFPPEKMEVVLLDVIRADEFVDFSTIQDSSYRNFSKRSALYDSIFHLHNITKEGFEKSMAYYQGRPDLLKNILDALQKKTDPANFKVDSTKILTDSVRKKIKKPIINQIAKPE